MNNKLHYIVIIVIGVLVSFPIVLVLYISTPLQTLVQLSYNKNISGRIFDCETGNEIENARISISGSGWGFRDNSLVWDKGYSSEAYSDSEGKFRIDYQIGTSVIVNKDGYLQAYYYTYPSKNLEIGLLNNENMPDKNERTYQCKLESECYQEAVKDGIMVSWDSCANPDYKP